MLLSIFLHKRKIWRSSIFWAWEVFQLSSFSIKEGISYMDGSMEVGKQNRTTKLLCTDHSLSGLPYIFQKLWNWLAFTKFLRLLSVIPYSLFRGFDEKVEEIDKLLLVDQPLFRQRFLPLSQEIIILFTSIPNLLPKSSSLKIVKTIDKSGHLDKPSSHK